MLRWARDEVCPDEPELSPPSSVPKPLLAHWPLLSRFAGTKLTSYCFGSNLVETPSQDLLIPGCWLSVHDRAIVPQVGVGTGLAVSFTFLLLAIGTKIGLAVDWLVSLSTAHRAPWPSVYTSVMDILTIRCPYLSSTEFATADRMV